MSMAAIFALLLASGACAQTEFRGVDGSRLAVLVCPVVMGAEEVPETEPEAPGLRPGGKRT